ncbi:MAG: VOC family protein [Rhodothalassiaceae bacterium]
MDLNQITLPAKDMAASIAFYETLGLRLIVHTHDRYARFECPMGSTTVSLHAVDADAPVAGVSVYFEVADVDDQVARLKRAGLTFQTDPVDQRWLWREAWLTDPAGNRVALYYAGPNRRFPPWRKEPAPD